jgi:hypothetical protein
LSITVTPASANRGACALEVVAPAEKMAMSRPVGSAVEASSTDLADHAADLAGGPDDPDPQAAAGEASHRPVPP